MKLFAKTKILVKGFDKCYGSYCLHRVLSKYESILTQHKVNVSDAC